LTRTKTAITEEAMATTGEITPILIMIGTETEIMEIAAVATTVRIMEALEAAE